MSGVTALEGVDQQGSQAGGTLDELACLAHLSAMGGCTRGRREDQCAARVTIQVPTLHDLDGASEHRLDGDPLLALGGDQGLSARVKAASGAARRRRSG